MSVLITAQAITQAGSALTLAAGGTLGHSTALFTFDNSNDTVKVNNFLGFANSKGLTDSSNNELILFNVAGSAVNYLQVSNADSGSGPKIAALGDDTNIDLDLDPKGSGGLNVGKNNSGTAGKITLFDGSSNGVSLASPSSMSGTTAYTLPTGFPSSSGYVLASTTSGTMSWASAGGGGSFSVTELSATITLGEIQAADDAASSGAKMWYVEPSSWKVPAGKTLFGIKVELRNTLFADSSALYSASPIGFADPSGSTVQPVFIGAGWNYGSYYNPSSPYLSIKEGPSFGWYWQDSSYANQYIVNDGGTSTDYINCWGSAGMYFSGETQLRVYFNQGAGSTTYKLQTGTTTSSAVIANLTMIYA